MSSIRRRRHTPRTWLNRWAPLVVAALGGCAYANTFASPFIFDDNQVVLGNPGIFHLWPPWQAVNYPTRWVADLSFSLNYAIGGLGVANYHLVNMLVHILAGLFLYGAVRRTLLLDSIPRRFSSAAPELALATALLWTLHPLHTESVTYVAQRAEALMGLFALATFYCFAAAISSPRPRRWYDTSLAICVVGMGTKEMMAAVPPLLVLYDWVFVGPSLRVMFRERWRIHLAFLLTLGIFLILAWFTVVAYADKELTPYEELSPAAYALTQSEVIVHYLRLVIVPHPLCLDYAWPPIESWRQAIGPLAFIIALLAASGYGLATRRAYGFLLAAFFLVLAPTSSFAPRPDLAFEHRMYLPSAAILILLVTGTYAALARWMERRPAARRSAVPLSAVAVVTLAAIFLFLTVRRNRDYRSEATMWNDVVNKRPDNYRACIGLSAGLIRDGRLDQALGVCQRLLARLPAYGDASPADIESRLARDQSEWDPLRFYAQAHHNIGIVALRRNDHDLAIQHFTEALRVRPLFVFARNNLASAFLLGGRTDEAARQWAHVLEDAPANAKAHALLGAWHSGKGHTREATEHLESALEVRPNDPFAQSQLAWALATAAEAEARDGPRAVKLARDALAAMSGLNVRCLDILGAAQAEAGDFDGAVKTLRKAIALLAAAPPGPAAAAPLDPMLPACTKAAIHERLALYKARKPYRAPSEVGPSPRQP